ncbi:phage tail protein [Streptomyces sp. NPDC007100]|uniref:phage tail protein n=1 Tax=Streptomyces sp. NPDC007100 TaxID=3155602 RepID=UPI0033F8EE41
MSVFLRPRALGMVRGKEIALFNRAKMGCVVEENVVKHQWQIELGDRRVETLKNVSGHTLKQDYIQLIQNSPDRKSVPDLVLGAPEFFGTVTLTRARDKSEQFTQWILDSRDPTKTEGSAQTVVLAYVNTEGHAVKRLQFDGARPSSWSVPDLAAGDSGEADETLELTFVSCTVM